MQIRQFLSIVALAAMTALVSDPSLAQSWRKESKGPLTCGQIEDRCYQQQGLCEQFCKPGPRAEPGAGAECFQRCSRTLKSCLDKLPAECDLLAQPGQKPVPRVVPQASQ